MDHKERETHFEMILAEHGAALRRLCKGYERIPALQEELEQEVYMNLWRGLPGYRGEASLRSWMYRVAHNTATKHCYRASRTPKGKQGDHDLRKRASTDPRPDEFVAEADARSQLMGLIQNLNPLDRQIMLLYLEDLPQAEIAQTTGLSLANVSTKIHRLKESLTQRMRK